MIKLLIYVSLSAFLNQTLAAQAWSGILSSTRAVDWSQAGLPATFQDGETTANPWTPPVRTQCVTAACNTVGAGTVTYTSINAALASAATGTYVLIPAGNYSITDMITMYLYSGVTLRGSGPQSTTLTFSGSGYINFGWAANGGTCTWSSGFTQGATSIGVSGCTGFPPHAGQVIQLAQCDTGTSGAGCTTGTVADNGGLFMCGANAACQRTGQIAGSGEMVQNQNSYITSVSGSSGSYTVTFTPGLMLPNWSSSNSPTATWIPGDDPTHNVYGGGIEDMTLTGSPDNSLLSMNRAYGSWVKGVRFIGGGSSTYSLSLGNTSNCLIINSYFYHEIPPPGSVFGAAIAHAASSNDLIINNIGDIDNLWQGVGSNSGNVIAYNYARDAFTAYVLQFFEHDGGSHMELFEGNQISSFQEDDTHGTHNLNTWFRSYFNCYDAPYSPTNQACLLWDDFSRFENAVGNVFGTAGVITAYEGTSTSGWVYRLGGGDIGDPLVKTTSMRWGNWDNVTNAVRWCGNSGSPGWSTTCGSVSEIPVSLSSPNVSFSNPVPSTTTLPASFFLPTTAHSAGGTGLSWWKVCTAWTTFPTACSTASVKPFPAVGPEVTGGTYSAGHAYDTPAAIAWRNLPVDTAYQSSYTITSSSWSGGAETLTITGLPSVNHLMGAFQLSGANAACLTGATINASNEVLITNSSSTTVSYALSSNPGLSCTGTFKFPDVRQFDQRVYQADSGAGSSIFGKAVLKGAIIQ